MYTFKEFIGNDKIIKNLQSAIYNNKLSHAYIINGEAGFGKKTLANSLAKTLQCENNGIDACCDCISCRVFDTVNHPDIIYIKPSKTKTIGVDDIRSQIVNIAEIKPYKYKYKIFIVDNADKMTVQAQNAILKTIEEPPIYAIFLLLSTNFNNFLPTILSRCVLLKIEPLPEVTIENYIIDKFNIDINLAKVYSVFARGSIGQAVDIIKSEDFIQLREQTIQWIVELKSKDIVQIFENAKQIEIYKNDIDIILDICFLWYRDLIIAKDINDKYIIQQDKLDLIKSQASEFDLNKLIDIIDIIQNTKSVLNKNANFQLAIEIMLLKIKERYNGCSRSKI